MPAPDMTGGALAAPRPGPAQATFAQFPTAVRFAIRTQSRNRLAALSTATGSAFA